MKRIINGKLYDTETAKEVGSWWNGLSGRDFGNCSETLYQKKTGEFFLYGEGGAASRYAERCGDGWCGGSKINPLTVNKAKQWAEENMSADEYIAVFGEVEE